MKFASAEVAAAAKAPDVDGAIAARQALGDAFAAQDIDAVAALFADDLIVNTPANRVARRDDVLGFFRAGRMSYEEADDTLDHAEARGDLVVLMGSEVVKPRETAANAGRRVYRRFTDVWRRNAVGGWQLTVRQSTITAVE